MLEVAGTNLANRAVEGEKMRAGRLVHVKSEDQHLSRKMEAPGRCNYPVANKQRTGSYYNRHVPLYAGTNSPPPAGPDWLYRSLRAAGHGYATSLSSLSKLGGTFAREA